MTLLFPTCRKCGCTDIQACVTDAGACYWVEPDLCSACAAKDRTEPVAWLHEITEPDADKNRLLSFSPDNPWSHWLKKHRDKCVYKVTALAPVDTAGPSDHAGRVEALKPFARFIEHHDGPNGLQSASEAMNADGYVILKLSPGYPPVTLGDFRRAREAIAALSRATAQPALALIEELVTEVRETNCPRPANRRRPDNFTAGQCFDALECGCRVGSALASAKRFKGE